MEKAKIKAPVGLKPRESKGKAVKNNPDDVELLREMLVANGMASLPVNTKVDAGLLKAIANFQKKLGFKEPDQVVDPGGTTFKALLPKFAASKAPKADVKSTPDIKMVELKYAGKTHRLLPKDYEKAKKAILKNVKSLVEGRLRLHQSYLSMMQEILDTMGAKQGWIKAIAHALIVDREDIPDIKAASASIKAHGSLLVAFKTGDLNKVGKYLGESEVTLENFRNELLSYHAKRMRGAASAMTVIKVTRVAAFTVLAAVAAPYIVVASAMTLAEAAAVSTVGAAVLMSAGDQLEKHASGQKVSFSTATTAVAVDGIVATLTAGVVKNMKLNFVGTTANYIAPKVAAKVPGMAGKALEPYIKKYLTEIGKATVKEGLEQALKITGEMVKSGKQPTAKQLDAVAHDFAFKAVSAGLLKTLESFDKKWISKHSDIVQSEILPDAFETVARGGDISPLIKTKVINEVNSKLTEQALKVGYDAILSDTKGNEGSNKMFDIARKKLIADRAFRKLVEREVAKALKKRKVKLK